MSIQEILSKIGMKKEQADIYIYALKFSEITTTQLSKILKKPRSSIYDQTQLMIAQGWLTQNLHGNRTSYSSISPSILLQLLDSGIENLLATKETIQHNIHLFDELKIDDKSVPKIRVFEGVDAIRVLQQQGPKMKEGYFVWNVEPALEYLAHQSMEELIGQFDAPLATVHRSLLVDNEAGRQYAALLSQKKGSVHRVKFLPKGSNPIQSDTLLMDNVYTHISYGEHMFATQITDKIHYDTVKLMFDVIWELL